MNAFCDLLWYLILYECVLLVLRSCDSLKTILLIFLEISQFYAKYFCHSFIFFNIIYCKKLGQKAEFQNSAQVNFYYSTEMLVSKF